MCIRIEIIFVQVARRCDAIVNKGFKKEYLLRKDKVGKEKHLKRFHSN